MTIAHVPPVDPVAQSQPTTAVSTASSGDWQRFERMLKTEMDRQNTANSSPTTSANHVASMPHTASTLKHDRSSTTVASQASASAKDAQRDDTKSASTDSTTGQASGKTSATADSSKGQTAVTSASAQATSTGAASASATADAATPEAATTASQDLDDQTNAANAAATTAAAVASVVADAGSASASAAASQTSKRASDLATKTAGSDNTDASTATALSLSSLGLPLLPSLTVLTHAASTANTASSGTNGAMAAGSASIAASLAGLGTTNKDAITAGTASVASAGQSQAAESSSGQTDQSSTDGEQSDSQQSDTAANLANTPVQSGQSGAAQTAQPQQNFAPLLNQLQAAIIVAPHVAAGSVSTTPQATASTPDSASTDLQTGTETGTTGLGAAGQSLSAPTTMPSTTPTVNTGSASYAASQMLDPAAQVALAIGRLTNGARSFSMQLNPEQLGAVSVRMDVDSKGKTKVAITADRPETLALLKQDSHHLMRALQEAGTSGDQPVLNFSLREQGSGTGQDRRNGSAQTASTQNTVPDETDLAEDTTPVRTTLSRHLYDIHA